MAEVEIIETGDGSLTGKHLETGATYRSVFGAVTEVRHVFIESTGMHDAHGKWTVVELGFGLGTSFCETAALASELGIELDYYSVERDPAPARVVESRASEWAEFAARNLGHLHSNETVQASSGNVSLTLLRTEWRGVELPAGSADGIYFDPFGPRVNPESWREEDFRIALEVLKPRGRLATYSAAGHVRRAMAAADFVLATRPGPGHKREITVASPTDAGLGDFERLSMSRYRAEDS